jgi:predicted DNA-binding antitoxin AbrB/MazE fold protein
MSETITAIYEQGVLRPLVPLSLPERSEVQIQIIARSPNDPDERRRVRQALLEAGLIRSHPPVEPVEPVSEEQLTEAAKALAAAGSLSEQIIADREGR